jgi:MFS family permease
MDRPVPEGAQEPGHLCPDDVPAGAAWVGSPRPRGSWRLLADRVFGPYILGKFMGTAGIWVFNIAAAIVAFQLTASAFVVGLVSVAQFAPQLVLAPLSGAMADRGDRRHQIVAGRIVIAIGSGGLAGWLTLTGLGGLPGAWPVVLAAFVVGMGFVVGGPAMNALVPTLARPHELATAIALNNVPVTVARTVGPAVGALLVSTVSPAAAFGVAALCNLIFAVIVATLPISGRVRRPSGTDGRVRAGLRHLQRDPTLIVLLVGVAAVTFGSDPAITLAPSLSAELGYGTDLVGLLVAVFGVGSIVAFPLMSAVRGRFGEQVVTTSGLCLMALGLLAVALAHTPVLACLTLGVAGAGMMMSLTSLSTQIQLRLPDYIRGRVMALWAVAFLGSRPLASAVNGLIADLVSVQAALTVAAVVVAGTAWWSRPMRIAPVPAGLLLSPGDGRR